MSLLTSSCYTDSLPVSSAVGRMWHPGGGSLALGDPGKLRHPVIIPSLPVSGQPADRSGNHYHGDWLPGLCWSCQREPSSVADGELFAWMVPAFVTDCKHKAGLVSAIDWQIGRTCGCFNLLDHTMHLFHESFHLILCGCRLGEPP